MDLLGIFGYDVIDQIQGFFSQIFATFFTWLEDLTGIDFVDAE
jgi:uncharacterized membrane protein YuzA (DUF378 family)